MQVEKEAMVEFLHWAKKDKGWTLEEFKERTGIAEGLVYFLDTLLQDREFRRERGCE